ncbi:MAG TPA: T9SS type A sorting domain-containing protein [Bacteroidales bacterium]|nr:T9SS type A sorting domain-containing protein [Bacteroidales bacterium]
MKKICAIILAMTVSIITYGQVSKTLVDDNKLWSNLWQTGAGPPPHGMVTNYIKFSADTTIDDKIYKKVLESKDEYQTDYAVIGYIREDSLKRVYYRDKNEMEKLLYDFGAKVGDSITIGTMTLVVGKIDYILINNEILKRMKVYPEGFGGEPGEQWIEGIGSLCGILSSGTFEFTGAKHDLLCFFENEALIYSNPEFEDCFYNTLGIGEIETNRFGVEIIPNPVASSSIMKIHGEFNNDLMIEIFTLHGIKIRTIHPGKSSIVLRNEDYVPGIYIFKVIKRGAEYTTGKFVVK